jgi:thiamine biosynthesis protein ThiS
MKNCSHLPENAASAPTKIQLNGCAYTTHIQTLDQLCAHLSNDPQSLAAAVNGHFVPFSRRAETQVQENDAVEIFVPMQGG